MSLIKKSFTFGDANFECWIYVIRSASSYHNEFWFKARDIATYLEYKNPRDAIINNVLSIWRKSWFDLHNSQRVGEKIINRENCILIASYF